MVDFGLRVAGSFVLVALLAGLPVAAGSDLVLILDVSNSMWGQIDGENKIVIARRVIGELVDGLPDDQEIGLLAYGHRHKGDCDDIEVVAPVGTLDRDVFKGIVDGLNPTGKTPITKSILQAFEVAAERDGPTTIVLVSDGIETCGGDPCAAVREARAGGIEFVMHVVGFDVAGEDVSQLECAAQAGNGLFLSAENADELGAALDAAVALPADTPPGRLSVKVIADGNLHDATVRVSRAGSQDEVGSGRTYGSPQTNPRLLPLPNGKYDVVVRAVGLKGDVERRFAIDIVDGGSVTREVDFSTGEVAIAVTRNGDRSDAVYKMYVAGTREEVASGRTYTGERSNPAVVRITTGEYDVEVGSVEISNRPWVKLGRVTVPPGGRADVRHEFATGTLTVGASRGGELVDCVVHIYGADGKEVARGRTYVAPTSNPKSWVLLPGTYTLKVKEVRGDARREIAVTVTAGAIAEHQLDLE